MRHGKDYREHFAHLLEHLVGEASSECEKLCPVDDSKDGGIAMIMSYSGTAPEYEGPSVSILLEAMTKMGFVVKVKRMSEIYYPTPLGIDYLEQYRHLIGFWIRRNWFPASVAAATITIPIVLKTIDIFIT